MGLAEGRGFYYEAGSAVPSDARGRVKALRQKPFDGHLRKPGVKLTCSERFPSSSDSPESKAGGEEHRTQAVSGADRARACSSVRGKAEGCARKSAAAEHVEMGRCHPHSRHPNRTTCGDARGRRERVDRRTGHAALRRRRRIAGGRGAEAITLGHGEKSR